MFSWKVFAGIVSAIAVNTPSRLRRCAGETDALPALNC
jgi:hypothetical protein